MRLQCYDYGGTCYKSPRYFERGIWFFYIVTFLNVTFDLLNILLLCKRTRSPINLILGKCIKENKLIIFFSF